MLIKLVKSTYLLSWWIQVALSVSSARNWPCKELKGSAPLQHAMKVKLANGEMLLGNMDSLNVNGSVRGQHFPLI
jgi:hypothetical protein